jgi:transposase
MKKLTKQQRQDFEKNPNVLKTTDSHVVFRPEFKLKAVKLCDEGMSPKEVFASHGLDFDYLNEGYFRSNIKRWRAVYRKKKEGSFSNEQRGRKATGRPKQISVKDLSRNDLEAFVSIQARIIEELKKRRALARKK